jgi:hypothetical protein
MPDQIPNRLSRKVGQLGLAIVAASDSHGAAAETSAALSAYRAKGDVVSAPMLDIPAVAEVETSAETLLQSG